MRSAMKGDGPGQSAAKPKPAIKENSRVTFRRSTKIELSTLILTGAVTACGALILSPVLPFYAMAHGGATAYEFACITAAYSLCQAVSAPLLGTLSDRIGRRPVLLTGILASAALYFVLAEAHTVHQLLIVRALLGFASGTEPAEIAFISDLTSKEERPGWIGLQMTIEALGALFGPAIGTVLAPFGFPWLCRVMGCICLLNLVLGIVFFTEPQSLRFRRASSSAHVERRTDSFKAVLGHFTHRATGPLLFAGFLDSLALAISDGPEAYYLRDKFNFHALELGQFFMVCSATTLVVSKLIPVLRQCFKDKAACVIFSVFSALSMAVMFICREPYIPYVYGALIASSSTVVEMVRKTALMSKMVNEVERGAIFGLECALLRAGFSIGPPLGGALYDYVHAAVPYAMSACCFLLSALTYSLLPTVSRGEPLLDLSSNSEPGQPQDIRALEHQTNLAPAPGKRFATGICADRARRVFFVDHELYKHFHEDELDHPSRKMARSHTIGVASMTKQFESQKDMRPPREVTRSGTTHV